MTNYREIPQFEMMSVSMACIGGIHVNCEGPIIQPGQCGNWKGSQSFNMLGKN